jgi:hypothetical protein
MIIGSVLIDTNDEGNVEVQSRFSNVGTIPNQEAVVSDAICNAIRAARHESFEVREVSHRSERVAAQ